MKYSLSCLAAILRVVNVNHTKCLFIRHSFFAFFGTACFRSPAHVCSRKEQPMEGKNIEENFPNVCRKAVICSFVHWFGLLLLLLLLLCIILFLPLFFFLFHSFQRRGKEDRDLFKCPCNTATLLHCGRDGGVVEGMES